MTQFVSLEKEYSMWFQKEVSLKARQRGFYLISDEICDAIPEISQLRIGLVHILLQHTSAALRGSA